MKKLIIVIATLALIKTASTFQYKDDYDYEYEDSKGRSLKDYSEEAPVDDEEDTVPEYKMEDAPKLFKSFIKSYDKKYIDQRDYVKHYGNFLSNLEYIIEHNKKSKSSKLDINMFADLGDDEVKSFTG